MNKKSKIYISGHTGFVGSNLLNELKLLNYKNLILYSRQKLDLLSYVDTEKMFLEEKPEYVFMCAAKVGGINANIKSPYNFLYENLVIQNNIINLCIKYSVKKVLFLGSSCIYPKDYIQPLKEEYLLKAPLEETNLGYALAKICGIKLCEYSNKQFNTKFISLMPCNLYGKGDSFDLEHSHVLSALVKKIYDAKQKGKRKVMIWGNGQAKREFLYIKDLISCMIWSMNNVKKTDSFLNVGTGKDISIIKLANLIKDLIGYVGEFVFDTSKPDGMMKKCLDITKISKLGWNAEIDLEEGLKRTIKYYEERFKCYNYKNLLSEEKKY